jgi:hypothetical protein
MKGWPAARLLLLSMLGGRVAYGADPVPCGASKRPWIQVSLASDFPVSVAPFVDLLRVELVSRGFDLCAGPSQERSAPTATIEVSPKPGGLVLSVEVRDAVTAKRVSRDIDLGTVPADSQSLMVALEADELLRASWAELALRSAPAPAVPVPSAVAQAVRDSVQPAVVLPGAEPDRLRLGVVAVGEHYAPGTTLYGADVLLGLVLTPRLSANLGFGLRTGPTVSATDGVIGTSALAGGLSASFTLTPPERRWGLDSVARFEVERLSFTPTARATALATPQAGYALLADAGLQGWFRVVRRLRIGAEILADLPVRTVYVTDGQARVAGVAGVGVGGGLGVWSAF